MIQTLRFVLCVRAYSTHCGETLLIFFSKDKISMCRLLSIFACSSIVLIASLDMGEVSDAEHEGGYSSVLTIRGRC